MVADALAAHAALGAGLIGARAIFKVALDVWAFLFGVKGQGISRALYAALAGRLRPNRVVAVVGHAQAANGPIGAVLFGTRAHLGVNLVVGALELRG